MKKSLLTLAAFVAVANMCRAQETTKPETDTLPTWGIKTNLLYDATTTFNLGVEFKTGKKTSLDISGNYNPWTFSDNKKWKHILVQPEFRLWTRETFRGSFFGVHAHYGLYNVGGLNHPPFSEYMNTHRFEGWLVGAGVGYGYRWNFNRRWAMEAEIGVGYAWLSYDKYACEKCGEKLGSETQHYLGPTKAAISLIYSFGAKNKRTPQATSVYYPPVPVAPNEPKFAVSYITPEVETVKQRSGPDKPYLDFAEGKADIITNYKNNAAELQKIYALVEEVRNNPDAQITGIRVTGYTSPEGTYQSNLTLSERRASALKNHMKAHCGFAENLFTVSGKGEDWATLDSLVEAACMGDKACILGIIRSADGFDVRERKLKDLGASYNELKTGLFPQLRRSDYQLDYTVLPFTVEKGKEVLKTTPANLSLNELFLIANTYEAGSDAFNEVFETAARVFPESDVANLNAAANALNRKDTASAVRYLNRITARNANYWNSLGILSYMQGDKQKAADCFAKAKAAGNAEAVRNAAELEKTNKD